VLIVGAARSGLAAASALRRLRPDVAVRLADRRPPASGVPDGVEVVLDDGGTGPLEGVGLVVKSPGVPGTAPLVAGARASGVPVWSEVELGFRLLGEDVSLVGVTGTNGKTTTTLLCAAMLEGGGVPAVAAGNIGDALSGLAGRLEGGETVVCELSSFQLEDVETLHARAGILLNLTPDHLDRHGTLEAYGAAKLRLFERQTPADAAVLCADDPWVAALADDDVPGNGRRLRVRRVEAPDDLRAAFAASALAGSHNLENALCAAAAAEALGAERAGVLVALARFRPPPHRLELVRERAGVRWINDSKATNPEAVIRALTAFDHVHLILGGSLKGADFAELAAAIDERVRAVYLIGEAAGRLAEALDAVGVGSIDAGTLEHAVELTASRAVAGDVVLLSPACASFDQFSDYEARGEAFHALVEALA
jgi:UDP-N-acetylmuramoylalanine--D-glutamate ligase